MTITDARSNRFTAVLVRRVRISFFIFRVFGFSLEPISEQALEPDFLFARADFTHSVQ